MTFNTKEMYVKMASIKDKRKIILPKKNYPFTHKKQLSVFYNYHFDKVIHLKKKQKQFIKTKQIKKS